MEAQRLAASPLAGLLAAVAVVSLTASTAVAAGYRTSNFVIDAPSPQLAKEIGDAAEKYRKSLALEWLGRELPSWSKPCPVKALVAPNLGAGGATSFVFDRGEVFGWKMDIQGSRERILDSVLPHEITHTIFASHFRQPVPRWADEGACTTVEHRSEIAKQERLLIDFLKTHRGIRFSDMLYMKEYPQDVLPLYAQGHSLAQFLIGQRGKREFLNFLADGMQDENWPRAFRQHYQYDNLLALQESWLSWVRAGRPSLQPAAGTLLASSQPATRPASSDASGQARAAMIDKPKQPQEQEIAASSPQSEPAHASAAVRPAGHTAPVEGRSVYGEQPSWRPQRRVTAAPVSAEIQSATSDDVAAYDASLPGETMWR